MVMPVPTEINHIKSRAVVRITWDDGHAGEYAETYLRELLPVCALPGSWSAASIYRRSRCEVNGHRWSWELRH